MTMWKRWIQGGVLCGLVLGGLVGCGMIQHPAASQVAIDDHAGQAVWHEREAARLRTAAKDELAMAEAYKKNPGLSTHGAMSPKVDMVLHCESIAGMYNKAAEEADKIAEGHRALMKK
ncbi:MAG: hypothetical protein CAF45_015960 [Nitrospira sp. CG24E]|nr:MAG: hypothetical protein CAF45_015960 [Nitrospira sp. CG24E]